MFVDALPAGTRSNLALLAEVGLADPFYLSDAVAWYQRKYAGLDVNVVHVVKSLAYFADAELDPSPRMLVDFSWDAAKRFFQQEAKSLLKTL